MKTCCFSSLGQVCKILLGFFQVENCHNHSLHNYCNYDNCSRDCGNYHENNLSHRNDENSQNCNNYHDYNNHYQNDDNYSQNCDNCFLFALCFGTSLIRSFVTGNGCQPADNDLGYDTAVLSPDIRFDGMVSSSLSPDQM